MPSSTISLASASEAAGRTVSCSRSCSDPSTSETKTSDSSEVSSSATATVAWKTSPNPVPKAPVTIVRKRTSGRAARLRSAKRERAILPVSTGICG